MCKGVFGRLLRLRRWSSSSSCFVAKGRDRREEWGVGDRDIIGWTPMSYLIEICIRVNVRFASLLRMYHVAMYLYIQNFYTYS